jgi:UDP-glucuronate 4-epimerase
VNFLVTGGAGFIGSHVVERLLNRDHAVWILDDLNPHYDVSFKQRNLRELQALGKNLTFVHGDITDRAAVDELFESTRFDQIIHLAARAGVIPSIQNPLLYQRVNVEGTTILLEAARLNGVQKVTIASSSSVYGLNSRLPFREDDKTSTPVSPYAVSKLATEGLGHTYHYVYGMDVALLRFFTVYGPRQRPDLVLFKFAEAISQGKPMTVYGDGSTGRDYTYVGDIADGVIACTERPIGYQVFNLANSTTVPLQRAIDFLESALGRKAIIERKPLLPGDIPTTHADISKAREWLRFSPKVSFEEGMARFVAWYKANFPAN